MEDHLPEIAEQCSYYGWGAGRYSFPDEGNKIFYTNPTIVARKDGDWLISRKIELKDDPWGDNSLQLSRIAPGYLKTKPFQFSSSIPGQQDEDPRAFQYQDKTFVSACSYFYYGPGQGWSGAHQLLGSFDKDWNCFQDSYPPIGGNTNGVHSIVERNEKNWIWFMDKGSLCLVYSCNVPWQVVKFGQGWSSQDIFDHKGIRWPWGTIRGGTSPVLVDGLYWTFFHSSVSWIKFGRRYFMGAVAFDSAPPFHPVMITKKPILRASDRDQTRDKPLVVFPCGSIFRQGKWTITIGVNDCYSAWLDIPHKDVYDKCISAK